VCSSDLILGSLKETRLDAQGRVTLTQKLKELGEIGNDIVIVGNGEKMDIWNTESWKRQQNSLEETGPYDADFYRLMNETRRNGNGV
jgi:DNA-binding transcriptional regulator/RsmH inhibitor MraZ